MTDNIYLDLVPHGGSLRRNSSQVVISDAKTRQLRRSTSVKTAPISYKQSPKDEVVNDLNNYFSSLSSGHDNTKKEALKIAKKTAIKYLDDNPDKPLGGKQKISDDYPSVKALVGGNLNIKDKVRGLVNLSKQGNELAKAVVTRTVVVIAKKNASLVLKKNKKRIDINTFTIYQEAIKLDDMKTTYDKAYKHHIQKKKLNQEQEKRTVLENLSAEPQYDPSSDPFLYDPGF
ncbi:MAG: hypothetical protein HRT47_12970 [Candidatus Caenarcaniphilales bacterium]|nr:hypothetical protein [Candidatus Caenarcaniphilales bacterium]